jgi:hypothetical protein
MTRTHALQIIVISRQTSARLDLRLRVVAQRRLIAMTRIPAHGRTVSSTSAGGLNYTTVAFRIAIATTTIHAPRTGA